MLRPLVRAARHLVDIVLALEHLRLPLGMLLTITVVGSIGYAVLLDVGWVDALYQAVTTLTTIGFGEVRPFDTTTKLFTVVLALFGVGTVFYVITMVAATVVEGELRRNYRRRIMMRKVDALSHHIIVCGYGRVGEEIAHMFAARDRDFVVVDNDPNIVARAQGHGFAALEGNAEDEEVLRRAGVVAAAGIIASTTSDACNTYITLTARALNPKITIVARAETGSAAQKLQLAGANRIVSPYAIGAKRMALAAMQPMMADFVDALAVGRHGDMLIAEFEVEPGSALDEASLATAFAEARETTVLGIRRADSSFVLGPRGGDTMRAGDIVIVMASESDLSLFAERRKHS